MALKIGKQQSTRKSLPMPVCMGYATPRRSTVGSSRASNFQGLYDSTVESSRASNFQGIYDSTVGSSRASNFQGLYDSTVGSSRASNRASTTRSSHLGRQTFRASTTPRSGQTFRASTTPRSGHLGRQTFRASTTPRSGHPLSGPLGLIFFRNSLPYAQSYVQSTTRRMTFAASWVFSSIVQSYVIQGQGVPTRYYLLIPKLCLASTS